MYVSVQDNFEHGVRIVPESRAEIAALQLLFGANLKLERPPLVGEVNSRGEPSPDLLLYREEIGVPTWNIGDPVPGGGLWEELARGGPNAVDGLDGIERGEDSGDLRHE